MRSLVTEPRGCTQSPVSFGLHALASGLAFVFFMFFLFFFFFCFFFFRILVKDKSGTGTIATTRRQ